MDTDEMQKEFLSVRIGAPSVAKNLFGLRN